MVYGAKNHQYSISSKASEATLQTQDTDLKVAPLLYITNRFVVVLASTEMRLYSAEASFDQDTKPPTALHLTSDLSVERW